MRSSAPSKKIGHQRGNDKGDGERRGLWRRAAISAWGEWGERSQLGDGVRGAEGRRSFQAENIR